MGCVTTVQNRTLGSFLGVWTGYLDDLDGPVEHSYQPGNPPSRALHDIVATHQARRLAV
jgi:hypothetical protein